MKNIIIFSVFSVVLQSAVLCQDKKNDSSADLIIQKFIGNNLHFNDTPSHSVQNSDSSIIYKNFQIFQIDSLKYVYELLLVYNLIKRDFEEISYSNKMLEHQRRIDLLLLTGKENYKNQPNCDLGEVGKYLGISKKIIAQMLEIISL